MNQNNIDDREVLDFKQFVGKVHDNTYKPLSPKNQSGSGFSKSGLSKIKREPAYDYAGYADSVFAGSSKVDVPGVRFNLKSPNPSADASSYGTTFMANTSESEENTTSLKRLGDF